MSVGLWLYTLFLFLPSIYNNVSSTTCFSLVSFANNSRLRGLKARHLIGQSVRAVIFVVFVSNSNFDIAETLVFFPSLFISSP